jgi:DNA primase
MDVKEQIKRSISIVDVVSLYVNLKPAGRYLKALCPFHEEKTPSFFIMPEKNTYTCYGCNKFGDIFTFIQEIENISFSESINFLIEKFNIPVDRTFNKTSVKKDEYLNINKIALKYFRDNLFNSDEGKRAFEYLKNRGINSDSIELFSLGYAKNKWDGLYIYLKEKSCDIKKSVELGLLVKNEKNHFYDRFRGRVIIPIFSESGEIIAFGGRTLFEDKSKYLNSPDTLLYKKSKHVYGFNFSKEFIRETGKSILVEGYFDMISLFQNGVKNVVASLGTALTDSQTYILKRFSDNIYMFYDNDKAGISAIIRGIGEMFEQDVYPRILSYKGLKDPDEFIKKRGIKEFNRLVDESFDAFSFLLNKADQDFNWRKNPEKIRDAIEYIKSFIHKMKDPVVRVQYIRRAADYFKVDDEEFKIIRKGFSKNNGQVKELKLSVAERNFLEVIIKMPELIPEIKDLLNEEIMSVLVSKNILNLIFQNFNLKTNEIDDYKKLSEEMIEPERKVFNKIFREKDNTKKNRAESEEKMKYSFLKFQDKLNEKKISEIKKKIRIAEREDNSKMIKDLVKIKMQYIKDKHKQQ